jgi:hypothetical protein
MYRASCHCYYIFRATGNASIPWDFNLTFSKNVTKNVEASKQKDDIQVVVYGHALEATSPSLTDLLSHLPAWVTPISWVSMWHSYAI